MARIARESQFAPSEMAIVHVVNRSVRRVFLMGEDRISGKNYEYRKAWIERRIEQLAACFGIDLLCVSMLETAQVRGDRRSGIEDNRGNKGMCSYMGKQEMEQLVAEVAKVLADGGPARSGMIV